MRTLSHRSGAGLEETIDRVRVIKDFKPNKGLHKAKIVCATCNNDWMSDIEVAAGNIVSELFRYPNLPRNLTKQMQTELAVWAFLKMLCFDAGKEKSTYTFFDRDAHIRFKKLRAMPQNIYIWLTLAPLTRHKTTAVFIKESKGSGMNPDGIQVCNILIGEITLQVLAIRDSDKLKHFSNSVRRWRKKVIRVWPTPSSADWPAVRLEPNEFASFWNRFLAF